VDGCLLTWDVSSRHARLAVGKVREGRRDTAPRSCLVFDNSDHLVRIGLMFLPMEKAVDVSVQPSVFEQVLPVQRGRCNPGNAGSTVARWLAEWAQSGQAWCPFDPDGVGLVGTAGGVAFPLLGAAYDRGATAIGEVPRWATRILSQPSCREGASMAFGAKANRTVVGSLAASLGGATAGGDGTVPATLYRLGLALMGEQVLESDRIARLLIANGPPHPAETWPTVADVGVGRELASGLPPARMQRLLTDAVVEEDGPRLLAELLREGHEIFHLLPDRPANGLRALRDQCRSLLPIDPSPGAGRWRGPRGPGPNQTAPAERAWVATDAPNRGRLVAGAPRPRRARGLQAGMRRPPIAREAQVTTEVALPRSIELAELNGVEVGRGFRIVIPRTVAELANWGLRLRNCVGGYGSAVVAGRSRLLGIERDGDLKYCLDLTASGAVRQFLGECNRPVPAGDAGAVLSFLSAAGVIDRE
jgi:hypothetical protein